MTTMERNTMLGAILAALFFAGMAYASYESRRRAYVEIPAALACPVYTDDLRGRTEDPCG